ncbi:DUF423 domain-containing protein [Dongia sp.]|uniref:DUF423 domain-containing protein n=1 Tax=Dongia sp. TaxID=1977262 RepID=UPI0035B24951
MSRFLAAAGFHGVLAVAFGAWSAHGAAATLPPQAVEWVKTGASYQLWHAVALLGIAALSARQPVRLVTISGLAFFLGALLFSGSLYLLALVPADPTAGPSAFVYVTPLGGGLLILGWVLLLAAGLKKGSL